MAFPILRTGFKKQVAGSLIAAAAVVAVTLPGMASAENYRSELTYRVKVTNITPAAAFTPLLGASHRGSVSFFKLGDPPSVELATLAEGGATAPLEGVLKGLPNQVHATATTSGLLEAGKSIEFEVKASRQSRYFSLAAMILPTNDSFVALDAVMLPSWGSRTYYANGYDAGSEKNDELCASIPGPVGCDGTGDGQFSAINGEGFVHISSGIHGVGDLPANVYDWRNPVAVVTITRVR